MKTSLHNINIDFDKSHGSYVFDRNTDKEYLDFMCMFSSLPLGYNHPVFDDDFKNDIHRVVKTRMTACEYTCKERERFEIKFKEFAGIGVFDNFHYTCTGSLAIEMAIKVAFGRARTFNPKIVSQVGGFHGITSYGNVVTDRTDAVGPRLAGFPGKDLWPKFDTIDDLMRILDSDGDIAGILIEPVQSTNGDVYKPKKFFNDIRQMADKFDVPIIFDEIQTGFCTTGEIWYFQHLGITPDIVAFGKKSQVCGVMSNGKYSATFNAPAKICVTWDGDLVDMVRAIYVMQAIEDDILDFNAEIMGKRILSGLFNLGVTRARGIGLLVAFDMRDRSERDSLVVTLRTNGMLCNVAGDKTIRLRPCLSVTEQEVDRAIDIIRNSL